MGRTVASRLRKEIVEMGKSREGNRPIATKKGLL